ncbi:MAG: ABC transporter permease subunit [Chloroflexi bacterium]|nr:ABC transporter permease subunit [Chloroflexota bacterium]
MSASIYRNVLTLAKVGVVSWSVVLVLWALLVVWIYPSLGNTGVNFEEYLDAMPEQLKAAMGIQGPDESALIFQAGAFTYVGYLNIEYISWLPLLLGIYAVVYCGGLVSKEVERGTLDVVLSQPVERTTFLLSKLSGFLTLALIATAFSTIAVLLGGLTIGEDASVSNVIAVHAVSFLLVAAIAGYSTLASCVSLDPGRSLAAAGVLTALTYFVNVLGSAIEAVGWLKYVSLFYYYDSLQVLAEGAINWAGVGVYVGVFAVTTVSAVLVFRRKDLVR